MKMMARDSVGLDVSQVAKRHFADLFILNYPNSFKTFIMYQQGGTRTEVWIVINVKRQSRL